MSDAEKAHFAAAMQASDEEPTWRTLYSGRSYVYALPCRDSDCLKIGFTREPLARMRALHERYFEFFDLDRAALIEVEHVRDARAIEKQLKSMCAANLATEPLVVQSRAGGKREWFSGVGPIVEEAMQACAARTGFPYHPSCAIWLRERWIEQRDVLYSWSLHAFEVIEYLHFNADPAAHPTPARALINTLQACEAVGMPLADHIAEPVLAWYSNGCRF